MFSLQCDVIFVVPQHKSHDYCAILTPQRGIGGVGSGGGLLLAGRFNHAYRCCQSFLAFAFDRFNQVCFCQSLLALPMLPNTHSLCIPSFLFFLLSLSGRVALVTGAYLPCLYSQTPTLYSNSNFILQH
jgi:hypothetical protein